MSPERSIRPVTPADAGEICRIYNHYIRETIITFEEIDVRPSDMEGRIKTITQSLPWLVAEQNGKVLGYAYAAKWKERSAYRRSVESTIYLDHTQTSRGLGTALYTALFELLRAQDIRTALGGIALPNPASIALHEKLGFRQVAHLRDVGFKFSRWIDVGYWQIMLTT